MTALPKLDLVPVTAASQARNAPAPVHDEKPAPPSGVPMPAPVASPRRRPSSTSAPAPASQPGGPWREWSPFQTTVSYKIPPELARELDERLHDLREPVGLTVVAAITHLLDQDDAAIGRLIDRAEQAKPRPGRRAGR